MGFCLQDSPIHRKLFVYAVCRCLEAGRARVVSIAPPLPMSTEVTGEKGSWILLVRAHYLTTVCWRGTIWKMVLLFLV